MSNHCNNDDHFNGSISSSIELFKNMPCLAEGADIECDGVKILDEEKIRCHILDCLVAFRRVQRQIRRLKMSSGNEQYESAKKRIFASAVSMILDEETPIESDQCVFSTLLASFPDKDKRADGRGWLPMHYAIALGNKVREEDIYEVHSADLLSIQRYNMRNQRSGYTPCHLLCMHRQPNISLVRYLSMRNLKAFSIRASMKSINKLQLAAKYSENVELLQILLQIDHSMSGKHPDHRLVS
jgi:hypothetical protein